MIGLWVTDAWWQRAGVAPLPALGSARHAVLDPRTRDAVRRWSSGRAASDTVTATVRRAFSAVADRRSRQRDVRAVVRGRERRSARIRITSTAIRESVTNDVDLRTRLVRPVDRDFVDMVARAKRHEQHLDVEAVSAHSHAGKQVMCGG